MSQFEESDRSAINIRNCGFNFSCTQNWADLTATPNDAVKFCEQCRKEVLLCLTEDALQKALAAKQCVAVHPKTVLDLKARLGHSAVTEFPPPEAIVEGLYLPADFDAKKSNTDDQGSTGLDMFRHPDFMRKAKDA